MYIKFTNKSNENNIYFIIQGKSKIKDAELKKYSTKSKYIIKGESFKIIEIKYIKNNKISSNTLIFVKNHKKLEENIENIVINLGNMIIKSNKKFNVSFKKTYIDNKTQENFIELLAQKLYNFNEYKTKKNIKYSINIDANIDYKKTAKKIEILYWVRDIQNMPANKLNPQSYEDIIKKVFKKNKNVQIKIKKGKELEKMGANGMYSVGKGSKYEPSIIVLEYKPLKTNKFKAIVGKGVTFDSGGYNIKPTGHIEDMHLDMGGSAVSLGIFRYLTETGYKGNLICAVGIVENMISSNSYSPTDIITMYNGKTVQITNTDAEGRLVLADTISYIEKKYKLDQIFDFATLTGAAIVALGKDITVIIGNNKKTINKIKYISKFNNENVWELPLYKKYKTELKSNYADLSNCGKGSSAGTIVAALFISNFVKNKNWVHFDIAGTNIMNNDPLYGTGGTGIQVRNIIKFFESEII